MSFPEKYPKINNAAEINADANAQYSKIFALL